MSRVFQALANEAILAAEHLALGVTAISYTELTRKAKYYEMFFSLSVGLERSAKLCILIDHHNQNGGKFQSKDELKRNGHNLSLLLNTCAEIANRFEDGRKLPCAQIHKNILSILTDFASNITRYYNIDLITDPSHDKENPISAWFDNVVMLAFDKNISGTKTKAIHEAELMGRLLNDVAHVHLFGEDGSEIINACDAFRRKKISELSAPYIRVAVFDYCRFLYYLISELQHEAYRKKFQDIPHLTDMYRKFASEESLVLTRKTWSIY